MGSPIEDLRSPLGHAGFLGPAQPCYSGMLPVLTACCCPMLTGFGSASQGPLVTHLLHWPCSPCCAAAAAARSARPSAAAPGPHARAAAGAARERRPRLRAAEPPAASEVMLPGPGSGYTGRVVSATDSHVRLELEAQYKTVTVKRDQLPVEQGGQPLPRPAPNYAGLPGSATPGAATRTPLHAGATPLHAWGAGATPLHPGATPLHPGAGAPAAPPPPARWKLRGAPGGLGCQGRRPRSRPLPAGRPAAPRSPCACCLFCTGRRGAAPVRSSALAGANSG